MSGLIWVTTQNLTKQYFNKNKVRDSVIYGEHRSPKRHKGLLDIVCSVFTSRQ